MLPNELDEAGAEDLNLASAGLEFSVRAPPSSSSDLSVSLSASVCAASPAGIATAASAESLCASTNPTMCSATDFEAPAHASHFAAVGEPPQRERETSQLQKIQQQSPPSSCAPVPEPPGGGAPAPPVELKLFVGRLPPSTDEEMLRDLFSKYGPVSDVVILRDRVSQQGKGCAFVRMSSITDADKAIRGLTNKYSNFAGGLHVRYAMGECQRLGLPTSGSGGATPGVDQAKLFVGSLPKDVKEPEVRAVFERYGKVEEVFLMRDNSSWGRLRKGRTGCAFVRFALKEQAFHAIANLSGKYTMMGASRALEVRFAESKRPQRRRGMGGVGAADGGEDVYSGGALASGAGDKTASSAAGPWEAWLRREGRAAGGSRFNTTDCTSAQSLVSAAAPAAALSQAGWGGLCRAYGGEPLNGLPFGRLVGAGEGAVDEADLSAAGLDPETALTLAMLSRESQSQQQGPPGANVFVFHIPGEWTREDLAVHFGRFGKILSIRVAQDMKTGRNKGYAFVNYFEVQSAVAAVNAMHGFQVNGKRLKVRIKKGEESFAGAAAAAECVNDEFQPRLLPKAGKKRPGQGALRMGRDSAAAAPDVGLSSNDLAASRFLEATAAAGLGGAMFPRLEKAVRQQLRDNLLSQHCAGLAAAESGVRERQALQLPPPPTRSVMDSHFQTRETHGRRLQTGELQPGCLQGLQGGRLSIGVSKDQRVPMLPLQLSGECMNPTLAAAHSQLRPRDALGSSASSSSQTGALPQLGVGSVVLPAVEELQGFFSQTLQLRD